VRGSGKSGVSGKSRATTRGPQLRTDLGAENPWGQGKHLKGGEVAEQERTARGLARPGGTKCAEPVTGQPWTKKLVSGTSGSSKPESIVKVVQKIKQKGASSGRKERERDRKVETATTKKTETSTEKRSGGTRPAPNGVGLGGKRTTKMCHQGMREKKKGHNRMNEKQVTKEKKGGHSAKLKGNDKNSDARRSRVRGRRREKGRGNAGRQIGERWVERVQKRNRRTG